MISKTVKYNNGSSTDQEDDDNLAVVATDWRDDEQKVDRTVDATVASNENNIHG